MTTLADLKSLLLSGTAQAPSLDLNFLLGALPPNANFSHAATGEPGTMFDASGTLVHAPHNLIPNSIFTSGWISALSTFATGFAAPDGTNNAIQVTTSGANGKVYNNNTGGTAPIGATMVQAGYFKWISGTTSINFGSDSQSPNTLTSVNIVTCSVNSAGSGVTATATLINGWCFVTLVWVSRGASTANIVAATGVTAGVFQFANPWMENNPYPTQYVQTSGSIVFAPRFDYSPTSPYAPRGILLEQASTNYQINSAMVGASAGNAPTGWTLPGTSNGITQTIVGSGTESGIPYLDVTYAGTATANGQLRFYPNGVGATRVVPATNGQSWAESYYLRLISGSLPTSVLTFYLDMFNSSGTYLGELTGGNYSSSVSSAPLSAQRYTSIFATNQATTAFVNTFLLAAYNNGQVVNFTLRLGVPTLEPLPFATSPIPTYGSAVTRNADALSVSGVNVGPGASGGLVASYIMEGAAGANQVIAQIDDGSANNSYALIAGTTQATVNQTHGGTTVSANAGAIAFGTAQKVAMGWNAQSVLSSALNGTAGSGVTGAQQTAALNTLRIGNNFAGTSPGSLWLSRLTAYGFNPSSSQLIGYTGQ